MRVYAPFASTKSSVSGPIASRATATRSTSRFRIAADFHFHARNPLLHPAAELLLQFFVRIGSEPAAAVNRHRFAHLPQTSVTSGRPSSFAFRSQSAVSTAEMAIEQMPGRPRLRIDSTIADPGAVNRHRIAADDDCASVSNRSALRWRHRHRCSLTSVDRRLRFHDNDRRAVPLVACRPIPAGRLESCRRRTFNVRCASCYRRAPHLTFRAATRNVLRTRAVA